MPFKLTLWSISSAFAAAESAPDKYQNQTIMAVPYREQTTAEFVDKILVGYDKLVHPNYYNKSPTNISINIFINSIDSGRKKIIYYDAVFVIL